jgi:hypothetical protein
MVLSDTDMGVRISTIADRLPRSSRSREATLVCTSARRRSELQRAFQLIYERYHQEGLSDWNPHGVRILPHQLLDSTWVLLANRGKQLCGTLSLIEDGAMGLPIEQLYPAEVWRLRRLGKRVAELACFALAEETISESMSVLRALLRSACKIAADRAIDEIVICVHPRRASFYERRLGFREIGPLRNCPWVCDQPAVAMQLNVRESRRTVAVIAKQSANLIDPISEVPSLRLSDREYFLRLLDREPARRSRRVAA